MAKIDYDAPAELFPASHRGRGVKQYRRFETAAEAIRFAIEELPAPLLAGAYLQVEDARFDAEQIRELYDTVTHPLSQAE
jgi:hypothetical protein